jgi:hypothetical protein
VTRRELATELLRSGGLTPRALSTRAEALRVGLPCLMLVRACKVRGRGRRLREGGLARSWCGALG